MVLRIDEDGPRAFVRPDDMLARVLTPAPDVVVVLAAGTITIEQAVAAGEVRGEPNVLRTAFVLGRANVTPLAGGD